MGLYMISSMGSVTVSIDYKTIPCYITLLPSIIKPERERSPSITKLCAST